MTFGAEEAARFCEELLRIHHPDGPDHGWTVRADGRLKRALGLTKYGTKTIHLSPHWLDINGPDQAVETAAHEAAHAIAGSRTGHGPEWQSWAKHLGARPEPCATDATPPQAKWYAVCDACGAIAAERHRLSRKWRQGNIYHASCGPPHGTVTWRKRW